MSTAAIAAIKTGHEEKRRLQGTVDSQQEEIRALHAELDRLQAESNMLKAEVKTVNILCSGLEDICHRRITRVRVLKECNSELITAHRRMAERAEKWRSRYNELLECLPGSGQDDQMRMVVDTEEVRCRLLSQRHADAVEEGAGKDLINSLWALLQSQKRRVQLARGGQL